MLNADCLLVAYIFIGDLKWKKLIVYYYDRDRNGKLNQPQILIINQMLYGKNFQEITLFKGKFNFTVRNNAPSNRNNNKTTHPSFHHQTNSLSSCDSILNSSLSVMKSLNHTTFNTSFCLSSQSANQTSASVYFSDDEEEEGWIILPTKYKPPSYSNTSNKSPSIRPLSQIRILLNDLFNARWSQQNMLRFQSNQTRKTIRNRIYERTKQIEKLKKESRLREIEHIKKSPHLINIHDSYRSEEIEDMFNQISKALQDEYKKGNQLIQPEKRHRRWVICLKVLTGRGNHSDDNISVLMECVYKWAKSMPGFECTPQVDHALLYIPITH